MLEKIELPMINLTPTMKCNLKCRLCGVLVPQYDFRPQMTIYEWSQTLQAVFAMVDCVDKLQITGGEPLLHRNLPEMVEECFLYSGQFEKLWLFTNCAVPMKPELTDVLRRHKDKIFVHVSDYGVKPKIAEELIQTLAKNDLEYRYLKYFGEQQYSDGWVDQGDFVRHNRSCQELKDVFGNCTHVKRGGSWYVRGGQMHWCGRSVRGAEVGKIPLREGDYLDVFTGTVQERREKLRRLMQADYIGACDYCNGHYGTQDAAKRFPAGEQL